MEGGLALDIAREAVIVLLRVGAPLLLVTLIVGILVSLLQALTQIQEMTMTFIPKILALFATFILMLPFMGRQLKAFTTMLFHHIETIT